MRYVIPGTLFVLFVYMAVFNAISIWKRTIKRQRFPSLVPVVPGVLGFFSIMLWPGLATPVRLRYAWIPLLADPGCVPLLLLVMAMMVQHYRRVNRFVRLATFESKELSDPRVTLVLYRTGAFSLKKEVSEPGWRLYGAGGDWTREGGMLCFALVVLSSGTVYFCKTGL